ncbi:MAG: TIGR02679 family protein, partial [Salinisphaera sp.]|uniref:TIGR02679 family protein n=1 Tax=Salinisphaera sp. TaxID=1914330 RepID=UPI003C7983EA
TLGDAHALDTGRPVSTLVRRALSQSEPDVRPREIWARVGVLVNELAKPVATLNLAVDGDDPGARLVATAAVAGQPLHLSLRLLARRAPAWQSGQTVFVCENPEVLAAAADALGPRCPPMICLDGQLSAAPRTLLDQLTAAGACFHYHGDFDWPGLRIANHLIARYHATAWRYRVADYVPGDGPPLAGEPVEADWDTALAPRMRAANVAVHEESQLDALIGDLARAVDPE